MVEKGFQNRYLRLFDEQITFNLLKEGNNALIACGLMQNSGLHNALRDNRVYVEHNFYVKQFFSKNIASSLLKTLIVYVIIIYNLSFMKNDNFFKRNTIEYQQFLFHCRLQYVFGMQHFSLLRLKKIDDQLNKSNKTRFSSCIQVQ